METKIPLSKEFLEQKAAEARRADEAKRRYAEVRGLNPITLKPFEPHWSTP
jgi:hypothetical protein